SQFKKAAPGPQRMRLEKYMRVVRCPACGGHRLNPQARAVRVGGRTLVELGGTPIGDLVPWFDDYERDLSPVSRAIAGELLKEIRSPRVPAQRRAALPDARPRRADALRRRGAA